MSVELTPNCDDCPCMGVANKTFYDMVNGSGMSEVIGRQQTNDPIEVSADEALRCKELLLAWSPPDGWGSGISAPTIRRYFLDFFTCCDGFTTH